MFLSVFTLKRVNFRGGVTYNYIGLWEVFNYFFWLCQDLNLAGVKCFNKDGGREDEVENNIYHI